MVCHGGRGKGCDGRETLGKEREGRKRERGERGKRDTYIKNGIGKLARKASVDVRGRRHAERRRQRGSSERVR
eukprot:1395525-Pleurochrysis_carterae.AAC.2